MTGPLIVLPWKFLAQANHRLMPVIRWKSGVARAVLITAPDYRQAKESAEYHIKKQWKGPILDGYLHVHARCFFPDRRKRDAINLSKMCGDAMSGIVYADDSQIHKEIWERADMDRENPRVEIEIVQVAEAIKSEPKRKKKLGPEIVPVVSLLQGSGKVPKKALHEQTQDNR